MPTRRFTAWIRGSSNGSRSPQVSAGNTWRRISTPKTLPPAALCRPATSPKSTAPRKRAWAAGKTGTPRIGAVYDLFGNHKTAIKAGIGKFDSQYSSSFTGNFNPMGLQSEALTSWNTGGLGAACTPINYPDLGPGPNPACYAIGGFAPQGTADRALRRGSRAEPEPELWSDQQQRDRRFARSELAQGLQLAVFGWRAAGSPSGVTLNVNWFRRSIYQGALVLNENALPLSDWTQSSVYNPLSGAAVPIFNLSPTITGLPAANLYETNAPQSLVRDTYTGYEFQVNMRLKRGIFATFGYTIERQLSRATALTASASPLPSRIRTTFGTAISSAIRALPTRASTLPVWAVSARRRGPTTLSATPSFRSSGASRAVYLSSAITIRVTLTPTTGICRAPSRSPPSRLLFTRTEASALRRRAPPARLTTATWLDARSIRATTLCRARWRSLWSSRARIAPRGSIRWTSASSARSGSGKSSFLNRRSSCSICSTATPPNRRRLRFRLPRPARARRRSFHLRSAPVGDSRAPRQHNAASVEIFPPLPIPG